MFDPFWTLGPTLLDFGASRQANEASSRAGAAENRVRELEHRVEKLALACSAMWELLRDQTGLCDQQLTEKIQHMDLADGVSDGKMRTRMLQCANCHRQVSPRRGKCMYCGAVCGERSVFEK